MKTLKLILIIFLFINVQESISCSCIDDYIENFCENADEDDYIVIAKIIEYLDFEKRKISIIENINNEILDVEITLLGANETGGNCGEELDQFSIGDTLIMNLRYFGQNEYMLFGTCGLNYLRFSNGNVIGQMYPNIDSSSYEDFVLNLSECIGFEITSIDNRTSSNNFRLFPNPTQYYLNLDLENLKAKKIEILSLTGDILIEIENYMFVNGTTVINLSKLNKGLYLIKISTDQKQFISRVIKT